NNVISNAGPGIVFRNSKNTPVVGIHLSSDDSIIFYPGMRPGPHRYELLVVVTNVVMNMKIPVNRMLLYIRPGYFQKSLAIPRIIMVDSNMILIYARIVNVTSTT